MKAILSTKRMDSWAAPDGMVPVQTFPVNIMHFLYNMYRDPALYEKSRHTPFSQWTNN